MNNQEIIDKVKKRQHLIIFGTITAILLIAVIFLLTRKNVPGNSSNSVAGLGRAGEQDQAKTDVATNTAVTDFESLPGDKNYAVRTVVPGANQVRIDNVVVTEKGTPTNNNVLPMTADAPKQTDYVKKEDLPAQVMQINVGNGQFSPKEFSTTKETPTTFSLTSVDNETHFITFEDQSLTAIKIFVGPRLTKAITFNAPKVAGVYNFTCGIPGHVQAGEVGRMIVK